MSRNKKSVMFEKQNEVLRNYRRFKTIINFTFELHCKNNCFKSDAN